MGCIGGRGPPRKLLSSSISASNNRRRRKKKTTTSKVARTRSPTSPMHLSSYRLLDLSLDVDNGNFRTQAARPEIKAATSRQSNSIGQSAVLAVSAWTGNAVVKARCQATASDKAMETVLRPQSAGSGVKTPSEVTRRGTVDRQVVARPPRHRPRKECQEEGIGSSSRVRPVISC